MTTGTAPDPAQRSAPAELRRQVDLAAANPVIDGVLASVGGILAVLNEHRQILAANDALLRQLHLGDISDILGCRPGEALRCIHADRTPGGCGTSPWCPSCGAAIAIVTSLTSDAPAERTCCMTRRENGHQGDSYFRVRSVPVTIAGERLLLLFLQDITYHQQLAALERVFYHDLNGLIGGLLGASELIALKSTDGQRDLAEALVRLSKRLANEVHIQRTISRPGQDFFQPDWRPVAASRILHDVADLFANHPTARDRRLDLAEPAPDLSLVTEPYLAVRVLQNMVVNACEETPPGGQVRIWCQGDGTGVSFHVWNAKPIPPDIAPRIFQRNFSTKADMGRGLGTYSMKHFGEMVLGGQVSFTSSPTDGTVFSFRLPLAPGSRRPA